MADRYKVTVEEDNDFSAVSWIILIVLGVLCFVYIGIPLLICYLLYKLIKYIIKRRKEANAVAHLKCPTCGMKDALRSFRDEKVSERPKMLGAHSKQSGVQDYVKVTEICTRHYEKCKYCGAIHYTDSYQEI